MASRGCYCNRYKFRQAASGIASSLHAMICLLDPHVIVFGGSVSNYNPDYIELVKEILETRLHAEQNMC